MLQTAKALWRIRPRSNLAKQSRQLELERLFFDFIVEHGRYPGSVKLAKALDVTPRTIRNYLRERFDTGLFLSRTRTIVGHRQGIVASRFFKVIAAAFVVRPRAHSMTMARICGLWTGAYSPTNLEMSRSNRIRSMMSSSSERVCLLSSSERLGRLGIRRESWWVEVGLEVSTQPATDPAGLSSRGPTLFPGDWNRGTSVSPRCYASDITWFRPLASFAPSGPVGTVDPTDQSKPVRCGSCRPPLARY